MITTAASKTPRVAVPFTPKVNGYNEVLLEFCTRISDHFSRAANYRSKANLLYELRREAAEHPRTPSFGYLKLMLAKNLLLDFIAQGWNIRVNRNSVLLWPAENPDLVTSKETIRQRHLVERDAQLREPSVVKFINSIERRRLTKTGWHSIYSVMRDGRELSESLRGISKDDDTFYKNIRGVIDPFLQFVEPGALCPETGLPLNDIWRYFRHTWVTSYKSTPGRTVMILVRDRARPGQPVIGIASLGSSIVQQSVRDRWIGWDTDSSIQRVCQKSNKRTIRKLITHLSRRIATIYKKDLFSSGVIKPRDLRIPSIQVIERLRIHARKAINIHCKYPDASIHKSGVQIKSSDWEQMARMSLFKAKRCKELALLLSIRKTLNGNGFRGIAIPASTAIESNQVKQSLSQIVRLIKAENVGINMMDITVCGAVAPYNAILGGKLICTLLCSPEVIRHYRRRYRKHVSVIASSMHGKTVTKKPELVLLCTTSLYGHGSSQYNRLTIPVSALLGSKHINYEKLGTSEGFGSFHFSKESVWLIDIVLARSSQGRKVNSIFGEGVNPLMRKIRDALFLLKLPTTPFLRHGNRRIVYGVALADNFREVLLGIAKKPRFLLRQSKAHEQTRQLFDFWARRWLFNRIRRPEVLSAIAQHDLSYPVLHGAQVPIKRGDPDMTGLARAAMVS